MTTKDERDRALCEAHCNDSQDEYFKARPHLDSDVNRRIFYAGHRKGWLNRNAGLAEKQEPVAWTKKLWSPDLGYFWDYKDGAFAMETDKEDWIPLYTAPVQSQDAQDAKRYRWLKDNCSYNYPMQPDSPAEHGIEYQWQQGCYDERNQGINGSIDAAIAAAEGSKE